jgi:hypothetical protein
MKSRSIGGLATEDDAVDADAAASAADAELVAVEEVDADVGADAPVAKAGDAEAVAWRAIVDAVDVAEESDAVGCVAVAPDVGLEVIAGELACALPGALAGAADALSNCGC